MRPPMGIICGTVQYSWCKHNTISWVSARVPSVNGSFVVTTIGHLRVSPGLCIKTRLCAQPLIWKWFFILMQIKVIFTRKIVHLYSFWKLGFLELGSGLFLIMQSTPPKTDSFGTRCPSERNILLKKSQLKGVKKGRVLARCPSYRGVR